MTRIAFLKILEHEGTIPNIQEIYDWILWRANKEHYNFRSFTEIKPFEDYVPAGKEEDDHTLVVWRFHRDDKITDEEITKAAGPDGYVLYLWLCPKCKAFVRRVEHPLKPNDNVYFGCSCRESVFYGACVLSVVF